MNSHSRNDLFSSRTKADNAALAARVKARIGVADAMEACGLNTDLGIVCPAEQCGCIGTVRVAQTGDTWACEACGTKGDAITIAMLAKDLKFIAACKFLEEACLPARRDTRTGELFAPERASSERGKADRPSAAPPSAEREGMARGNEKT